MYYTLARNGPPKLHNQTEFLISPAMCCFSLSRYVKPTTDFVRRTTPPSYLQRGGDWIAKNVHVAIAPTLSNVWPETLFSPSVLFYFCPDGWCSPSHGVDQRSLISSLLFLSLLLFGSCQWIKCYEHAFGSRTRCNALLFSSRFFPSFEIWVMRAYMLNAGSKEFKKRELSCIGQVREGGDGFSGSRMEG